MKLYKKIIAVSWLLCMAASGFVTPAHAQTPTLIEFFAGEGCAIGPSTKTKAEAAGFSRDEISSLEDAARAMEGTKVSKNWMLLPASICTIQLPDLAAYADFTAPDVAPYFSKIDEYAADGYPGCFLTKQLSKVFVTSRSMDPDTATKEFVRLMAAGLITGKIAFYSDSTLSVPPDLQLLTGACAKVPNIEKIKSSGNFLRTHFDKLLRSMTADAQCLKGMYEDSGRLKVDDKKENSNEWTGVELQIIGKAAGWYEGMSATNNGVPRLPFCN